MQNTPIVSSEFVCLWYSLVNLKELLTFVGFKWSLFIVKYSDPLQYIIYALCLQHFKLVGIACRIVGI